MSSPNEFRLERGDLSEETMKIAEAELRETPERKKEAIERLRELLRENDDIYFGDDDEIFTIFLRPTKFYPDSALLLMRKVAQFKRDYASILTNLMPQDVEDAFLNHKVVNVLKSRDHKGRRVLITNTGSLWDPKKVTADQLFKLFYLIHEAAMLEPESQVRGVVVLMDFNGMGLSQARAFSPSFSQRLVTFIQDAMPLRLKEVHFVKQPMVFNMVWQLFKPFLKEKLKSRIYFHGKDMASLHKHLAPSHLPADYGGNQSAIDYSAAEWFPVISEVEPHIERYNTYGFVKSSK